MSWEWAGLGRSTPETWRAGFQGRKWRAWPIYSRTSWPPWRQSQMSGKHFQVGKTFSDYRRVLELPEVDAVAICTPTNTHYQMILDAAAAGKHIFCEKPIDLSIEKIVRINAEVEKRGVELMVGFNRRYDPNFLKVHDTVKAGGIGEPHILRITSRDPAPPPETYIRASGGIFLDMTIHDFDMARYLMGDVTEVYARADVLVDPVFQSAGDWDTVMVTLTFANGALGAIDNSRKAVYGYDQRVEVFGSEGMIAVKNNTHDNHVRLDREGTHSALPLDTPTTTTSGWTGRALTRLCRSISSWTATRNPI
ncbi:MAG: Gfo/Idh/MocA family oxidoreductase [Bryobacteraceae bacterium]